MKYLLALVFVANLGVWVWGRTLPADPMLDTMATIFPVPAETNTEVRDAVSNARYELAQSALESYRARFAKHRKYGIAVGILLPINAVAVFILILMVCSPKSSTEKQCLEPLSPSSDSVN